nr:hypothetical protein [Rathayibacter sp. AY1C1]
MAETDHDVVGSSLCLHAPGAPAETQVLFSRIAGINIVGGSIFNLGWTDVFAAASPHEVVKRVEADLMLTPLSPVPPCSRPRRTARPRAAPAGSTAR